MIAISRAGRMLRNPPDDDAVATLDAMTLAAMTGHGDPLGANVWAVTIPFGGKVCCCTFATNRVGLPVLIDIHRERSRAP